MPADACVGRSFGGSGVAGDGADFLRRVVEPSHRGAPEVDAVRVVEESVEDGVAEGGIADDVVPVLDGDLAGEQRAAAGVAVVEDLEEVVPSLSRERGEPPVVEDEEPGPGEPLDDLGIRSVAPGEGEFVEKAGDAVVARGDAGAAGLVAERARDVRLSRARGPADQHRLAVPDPLAGGEVQDEGAVETSRRLEVDVLDGRVEVEPGMALEALVAALLAFCLLAFEEQGEAVVEGQLGDVGHAGLLFEGLGHAREPEFVEQVEGGLAKHGRQDSFPLRGVGA